MATKKVFKNTVPALAYADSSEIEEPWLLCSLLCKFSPDYNVISLLVTASVSLIGSDEEQAFVLVYNADNLIPGATTLAAHAGACAPAWLEKIAREGFPRMHTLSLTLKNVCSVWYTRGQVQTSLVSYPTPCQQLVEIAKADKVRLIVDFSRLQDAYKSCIRRLTSNATGLAGYPISKILQRRFEQGDWTVFQPLEASIEPPAYTETPHTETSHKRPRRGK
jgi:hypothetical protein